MHLAFIIHCVYYYLVNNYGNIDTLTEVVWSFKVSSYIDPPCTLYWHIDGLVQLQIVINVIYIS
jgi:hypothetical protein